MKLPKNSKSHKINEIVSELFSGKTLEDAESEDETTGIKIAEFDHREHDGSGDDEDLDNQLSEFRKKNMVLLNEVDKKYRGSVVSRKDLDSDDEDADQDDEESDEDVKEEAEDDDEADASDEEAESENEDSNEEDEDSANEDEVSGSGDSNIEEEDTEGSDEDNLENDTQVIFNSKPGTGKSDEIKKGLAVQNQLKVWEHLLELRIHSQKLLTQSNSLPPQNVLTQMLERSADLNKEIESLQNTLLNLLDNVCELQRNLLNGFPDTKSLEMQKPNRKRKYDDNVTEYGSAIEHNYHKYKSYGDATIQKWYDRTKVFSNNLKSKSIPEDANIVHRIETVLVNKGDLIKKSQLHKGGYELYNSDLNNTLSYETKEPKHISDDIETMEEPSAQLPEQEKNVYSTEIYDDTDFYHQLLRGLIEFKTATLTNPHEISKQYAELEKLRKKMKKVVDTRASKGRKIRYVVHKKLVNFMAPNPHCDWTNEARDELFSSLFGKVDNKIVLND